MSRPSNPPPTARPAFALCLAATLLGVPGARAADPPPDLAVVPGDAAAFLSVDVPAVVDSPLCDEARLAFAGLRPGEFAALARKFPVDPRTVRRAVVIAPTPAALFEPVPDAHPTAVSALLAVTCSEPFDRAGLLKAFHVDGRPKAYRGHTYQFDEDTWSGVMVLPGDRTFVVGAEDSLVWLIDRLGKADAGPLSAARTEAARHTVFLAVQPRAAVPAGLALPPGVHPLADARCAVLAVDLGPTLSVSARLDYPDADGAAAGARALRAAADVGRVQLRGLVDQLQGVIDRPGAPDRKLGPAEFPKRFAALLGVGALRQADRVLETLPIETRGNSVGVAYPDLPPARGMGVLVAVAAVTSLGTTANATFQSVEVGGGPDGRPAAEGRLRAVAAAFDAYHADHGRYPPAALRGRDGTPLLSWRVALLPYLGQKELYREFKLDEPWDSLHNKKLIARLPAAFRKPFTYPKDDGRTNTLVVTGPGTLFDGSAGVRKADVADGLGRTMSAVEAGGGRTVYWTKPADLTFAPGRPPDVFGPWDSGSCWAVFADGSVRALTKKEDGPRLSALITRAGKD